MSLTRSAPRQLTECGSIAFTRALVTSSDHLALLPEHAVTADVASSAMRALNLSIPALSRDIALIFREGSPLSPTIRDPCGRD
jgi:DNA-binding transcriptional LysR family regulator